MGFYETIGEIYTAEDKEFNLLVDELLRECSAYDIVLRLIFFGKPESNEQYIEWLGVIQAKVLVLFGGRMPVVSFVAQCPLVGDLVLEVYKMDVASEAVVSYRSQGDRYYLEIEDSEHQELILGGLQGEDLNAGIAEQSDRIFEVIDGILKKEGYAPEAIVRQWNYIERITAFAGGHQHYQDFNDSRSRFYAPCDWKQGYPAATGIGTQFGGVLIDLNVVKPKSPDFRYVPLDNELQVAAHAYSQEVLVGIEDRLLACKTTPKFERAKAVVGARKGMVYISGTAAIRGEQSLEGVGVLVQTGITMENIRFLISSANLNKQAVFPVAEPKIELLRVYLKNPADVTVVKVYMESLFTEVPVSYLLADVCRDELLVEIEGIASFQLERPMKDEGK